MISIAYALRVSSVTAKTEGVKNRAALIESLNEAISIEHTLAMQCYQQSLTIRGLWRLTLAPLFAEFSQEANDHARKFGHKVAAFGGIPTAALMTVKLSGTGEEMLQDNLRLERAAMAAYQRALELADDDLALKNMLEDHVEAEQRHIEELELLTDDPGASRHAAKAVRRVS